MNSIPNLFSLATSELSQDAFICWLITWADKKHESTDSGLNKLAIQFVQKLLGKDNSYAIDEVKVKRQWHKIDVSALVNGQYFLVIEDKKGTRAHSNQLNRYSERAKKHYKESDIEVKLIYFKMEEQGDYTKVEEAGFTVFGRGDMLEILDPYFAGSDTPKNDIICDYYEHLKRL
ncbi:MAG: PD-(D/E)XK nuclease family protein, partial [Ekhidna sp.]|nr:PD-(D/E)XK nuclease family protein [Ekhidna sp.]